LLLLLLLVPLLLLLPLVLFEGLEFLEICAWICKLSCIGYRSNLSVCVQTLSVVADDCAVALLLAVRTGHGHGLFASVWFALAFTFVDDCIACGCCTG
jgi:hypothetical protein